MERKIQMQQETEQQQIYDQKKPFQQIQAENQNLQQRTNFQDENYGQQQQQQLDPRIDQQNNQELQQSTHFQIQNQNPDEIKIFQSNFVQSQLIQSDASNNQMQRQSQNDENQQKLPSSNQTQFQSQILSQLIFSPQNKSSQSSNQNQMQSNCQQENVHSGLKQFSLDIDELRQEIFQQKKQKYYTNLLESSLKKLQILLTTHPEIDEDLDFVYQKGSSISYFARQNLTAKGFFQQYGNYTAFEKPLKVITMTVNVLFEKLNKLYEKNKLKQKLNFQINKQILVNIDQQFQELEQNSQSNNKMKEKLEEQQITNETAYLYISMYHSNQEKIETTQYLDTFQRFVEKVELRKISDDELKKISLLISEEKTYLISWSQINNFFNGFWTSPTDFEYLQISQILPMMNEQLSHKKVTLVLEKVVIDEKQQFKNFVLKGNNYTQININDKIEINSNQKGPFIFGRQTKSKNQNFFIFSAEQKLISRHQFSFNFSKEEKFKLKCTSTGNPTCIKLKANQEYLLQEGMLFFLGNKQGFLVKTVRHGRNDNRNQKGDPIDLLSDKKRLRTLLQKRTQQSVQQNIHGLVEAQKKEEQKEQGVYQNSVLFQSALPEIIEENKEDLQESQQKPYIEIMGLGETKEEYKTDFAWQTKTFYSSEISCVLLGSSAECGMRFEHNEIHPKHAEINYNEESQKWVLSSPFPEAETFISMKTLQQLKYKEDTKEFDISEGMVIAVECNEFRIDQIERAQPF